MNEQFAFIHIGLKVSCVSGKRCLAFLAFVQLHGTTFTTDFAKASLTKNFAEQPGDRERYKEKRMSSVFKHYGSADFEFLC